MDDRSDRKVSFEVVASTQTLRACTDFVLALTPSFFNSIVVEISPEVSDELKVSFFFFVITCKYKNYCLYLRHISTMMSKRAL